MNTFILSILGVLALAAAYLMFVVLPVAVYADAECLRKGYPIGRVTVGLDIYCTNLDGAVTVDVMKQ